MTESEYLERDARDINVGRPMVECRTKAPKVHRRAFALHYAHCWRHDRDTGTVSLESAVRAHPRHVQVVIDALKIANLNGARYENLIVILHAMHERITAKNERKEITATENPIYEYETTTPPIITATVHLRESVKFRRPDIRSFFDFRDIRRRNFSCVHVKWYFVFVINLRDDYLGGGPDRLSSPPRGVFVPLFSSFSESFSN